MPTNRNITELPDWGKFLGPEFIGHAVNYYTGGPGGDILSYAQQGGPMLEQTQFDPVESLAQQDALGRAKAGSPLKKPTDQFYLDQVSGVPAQLARSSEAYFLGGPAAGATRESLLSQLMGRSQGGAEGYLYNRYGDIAGQADQFAFDALGADAQMGRQALQQEMFGGLSNAARQSVYGTLSDQDLTRGAEVGSIAGGLANQARQEQMRTIGGAYLDPETNPHLQANVEAAMRQVAQKYKYGTGPS